MKKSQLQRIIKEEVQNVVREMAKKPVQQIPSFIKQYVKKSLSEFDYPLKPEYIDNNKIGAYYKDKASLDVIQIDMLPDNKISIDMTDSDWELRGNPKIFKLSEKNKILKYIESCLMDITEELIDDIGASEW